MKIYVYAICKNESAYVDRFMDSTTDADGVYVLDTGSTDDSVEKLIGRGAVVCRKSVKPWRFDVARNMSLELVPDDADLCIALDLDEVLEKEWRSKLENNYVPKCKQVKYRYIWSHDVSGRDGHVFWADKIHVRKGFVWVNAVHEVLKYCGDDYSYQYVDFRIDHYPDEKKSRAGYLPLLELSVKEDPNNDRNMHYLAREYMFYGRYAEAIDVFCRHLEMPTARWSDERSASMRFAGLCFFRMGDVMNAKKWYFKAIAEAPYLREPYVYLAELYFGQSEFVGALFMCERALEIKERSLSYINEPLVYGELPYDLASLSCFYLGLYDKAEYYVDKAIEINPQDERLLKNKRLIADKKTN